MAPNDNDWTDRDSLDADDPELRARGWEILNDAMDDDTHDKWETDFRPSITPDGRLHLDGAWDFDPTEPASQLVPRLKDRAEEVGGLVTHDPDAQHFTVNSHMGALLFRCHYGDNPDAEAPIVRVDSLDPRTREVKHQYRMPALWAVSAALRHFTENAITDVTIETPDQEV